MIEPYKQGIEEETGRKVVSFMGTSHQHPDLLGEMFVLETSDLLLDEPTDSTVGL